MELPLQCQVLTGLLEGKDTSRKASFASKEQDSHRQEREVRGEEGLFCGEGWRKVDVCFSGLRAVLLFSESQISPSVHSTIAPSSYTSQILLHCVM